MMAYKNMRCKNENIFLGRLRLKFKISKPQVCHVNQSSRPTIGKKKPSIRNNAAGTINFAILSSGGEHFRVSGEAHAQHRVVHHHEVFLSLVLQIFADFSRGEIPNFNKSVHRSSHQILTVRRESMRANYSHSWQLMNRNPRS